MSYAASRPAKLKISVISKLIGVGTLTTHKVGKKVKVQRNPTYPNMFILWFSPKDLAQIPAIELSDTIEYTDGKPEGWQ